MYKLFMYPKFHEPIPLGLFPTLDAATGTEGCEMVVRATDGRTFIYMDEWCEL